MTLEDYLFSTQKTLREFSEQCGVSPATLFRAKSGVSIPSRKTLQAIVNATDGQVTIAELIPIEFTPDTND